MRPDKDTRLSLDATWNSTDKNTKEAHLRGPNRVCSRLMLDQRTEELPYPHHKPGTK